MRRLAVFNLDEECARETFASHREHMLAARQVLEQEAPLRIRACAPDRGRAGDNDLRAAHKRARVAVADLAIDRAIPWHVRRSAAGGIIKGGGRARADGQRNDPLSAAKLACRQVQLDRARRDALEGEGAIGATQGLMDTGSRLEGQRLAHERLAGVDVAGVAEQVAGDGAELLVTGARGQQGRAAKGDKAQGTQA